MEAVSMSSLGSSSASNSVATNADGFVKNLVSEWQFKANLRKKKVPLNKYGLPDVSGDAHDESLSARQAFREQTEAKLLAGWSDGSGFGVVVDCLSMLLDLITSFTGGPHSDKIRKMLDIDVLRQMVKAHVFTPEEFKNTVKTFVAVLNDLESPYQSAITQAWYQKFLLAEYASVEDYARGICEALMILIRKCEVCKIEVENYYISLIPRDELIKRELAAYLKIGFPHDKKFATKKEFTEAIMNLIGKADKISEDMIPRCLVLDLFKLHQFQYALQQVTLCAIMSAVFNKLFATWHVDKVKEYMDAVMSAYDTEGGHHFFDLLAPHITEAEIPLAEICCATLIKCADVNDPLYKVFADRAKAFLLGQSEQALGERPVTLSIANDRLHALASSYQCFIKDHLEVYESVHF